MEHTHIIPVLLVIMTIQFILFKLHVKVSKERAEYLMDWVKRYMTLSQMTADKELGASSQTMAVVGLGIDCQRTYIDHPCDADDLIKCFNLVLKIPEVKNNFAKIAELSSEWSKIIENWELLWSLYQSDTCDRANVNYVLQNLIRKAKEQNGHQ